MRPAPADLALVSARYATWMSGELPWSELARERSIPEKGQDAAWRDFERWCEWATHDPPSSARLTRARFCDFLSAKKVIPSGEAALAASLSLDDYHRLMGAVVERWGWMDAAYAVSGGVWSEPRPYEQLPHLLASSRRFGNLGGQLEPAKLHRRLNELLEFAPPLETLWCEVSARLGERRPAIARCPLTGELYARPNSLLPEHTTARVAFETSLAAWPLLPPDAPLYFDDEIKEKLVQLFPPALCGPADAGRCADTSRCPRVSPAGA